MNITFSKLVKMNGRLWEVNFRKQPGHEDVFHGDTPDLQGNRYHFILEKKQTGQWNIAGNDLPEWLVKGTEPLAMAVESGMDEFQQRYAHQLVA